MKQPTPSFFVRFFLAFAAFARILFDADFAAAVLRLHRGEASSAPPSKAPEATPAASRLQAASPDSALQLLGLLQQEGRFIDFIEEDVAQYSDAEIGAAVRVVHEGCRRVLLEQIPVDPVRSEPEGARIVLEAGFDASAIRVTGNVVGEPPFSGTLAHRGWRAREVRLPKIAGGHDMRVLAPAEVEL